jgi:outer membrane protein assembly factor BamD
MGKADRDPNQAYRTEQECKQEILQYPNSQYVTQAEQILRNTDEVLAEGEMLAGDLYYKKGAHAAAANRYEGLAIQYPLYSKADLALWKDADSYLAAGTLFRPNAISALQRIVRDYPGSAYADLAKKKLHDLEAEVPEADPAAVARMKYEEENRTKTSTLHNMTGFLRMSPETSMAAKTGTPAMNPPKQLIPVNVPKAVPTGAGAFNGDVTVAPATTAAATPTLAVSPSATDPNSKDAATSKDSKDKKNAKKNAKKDNKKSQDSSVVPITDPSQSPVPPKDPIPIQNTPPPK